MTNKKVHEHGFVEAKTSGGAVYELGVKTSKYKQSSLPTKKVSPSAPPRLDGL